jgi:hypothetical protein
MRGSQERYQSIIVSQDTYTIIHLTIPSLCIRVIADTLSRVHVDLSYNGSPKCLASAAVHCQSSCFSCRSTTPCGRIDGLTSPDYTAELYRSTPHPVDPSCVTGSVSARLAHLTSG